MTCLQQRLPWLGRLLKENVLKNVSFRFDALDLSNMPLLKGQNGCAWSSMLRSVSHVAAELQEEQEGFVKGKYTLSDFAPERIRNFSIIAHIDHGKSTLADRMMELTGAVRVGGAQRRLDTLQVEKERGITVKAQTSSLVYKMNGIPYLLNLIDTPGHVDFSYEVSRSLAACDGVLLLVDAAQGIQAQTVANFYLAFDQGLEIIPVLNKIDMPAAEPEKVAKQMCDAFDMDEESCLHVSAKTGYGVDALLRTIIEKVPPPRYTAGARTRMLLFDAYHDEYRGVVSLVQVVDGKVSKGQKIVSLSSGETWETGEIGILTPDSHPTGELLTGQVGYVLTGMKNTRSAQIGDTWCLAQDKAVEVLPGFREPKSMVFAGIFPVNAAGFDPLLAAIEKLTLNDSSVSPKRENSTALGAGFRCGFLGLLHMDVFKQRLEQEYGTNVIITSPTVPVKIHTSSGCIELKNPAEFPTAERVYKVEEPTVLSTIILPSEYIGSAMQLCTDRRGDLVEHVPLSSQRVMLRYILPLAELGGDFYDELKSLSSGFASFDYEEADYREADLVKMDILVNGDPVDALARIVHRSRAPKVGKTLCANLKRLMDRQQFDIALQAAAGGRIVARETIKAYRKNVLAKCYGGDISRKKKLLEKQKEGKKRLRKLGAIEVPTDALHEIMQSK